MTQDEYNALTDDAQNALFATEVMGWRIRRGMIQRPTPGAEWAYSYFKDFDPINNLDYAFMGVDKILVERGNCTFTLGCGEKEDFHFIFGGDPDISLAPIWVIDLETKTPNEAIMLACLRAKGVVE